MPDKRIALIDLAPDYFFTFSQALEQQGFEVYWVSRLGSHTRRLTRACHVPARRVLDLTAGFRPAEEGVAVCRQQLAALETNRRPRIHDVILMDRHLRTKTGEFALKYLHHLQKALTAFLLDRSIGLVVSGRDTALAMVSMLVSRSLGVPWVVPTRLRIPRDTYFFCNGHETSDVVRIREVTDDDRAWARQLVREFRDRPIRPAASKSTRTFGDVVRMMPEHARLFWALVRASVFDRGNDHARYTIPRLISRYVARRVNLLAYTLRPPFVPVGTSPFCLYTLHAQPESIIDVAGSYYSDQIGLIRLIARSLPVTHELYVKVHPLSVDGRPLDYYREIARIPGVRLINYDVDSRDLVLGAAVVFALTGTVAYEAALLGKPVITFGSNNFNSLPTVHFCDIPSALPALISSVLEETRPGDVEERIIECVAELRAQCFSGEFNRAFSETTESLRPDDLKTLQVAYETVYRVLVTRQSDVRGVRT